MGRGGNGTNDVGPDPGHVQHVLAAQLDATAGTSLVAFMCWAALFRAYVCERYGFSKWKIKSSQMTSFARAGQSRATIVRLVIIRIANGKFCLHSNFGGVAYSYVYVPKAPQ